MCTQTTHCIAVYTGAICAAICHLQVHPTHSESRVVSGCAASGGVLYTATALLGSEGHHLTGPYQLWWTLSLAGTVLRLQVLYRRLADFTVNLVSDHPLCKSALHIHYSRRHETQTNEFNKLLFSCSVNYMFANCKWQ